MWSRDRFRKASGRGLRAALLALACWAAGAMVACHLEPEEETFLAVRADSSWLALDSVSVLLQDSAGDTLEVLRHGPLDSLEELERLPTRKFSGRQAVLVLIAYRDGLVVRRETRAYDGRTQATTDRTVEDDPVALNPGWIPPLIVKPDTLRLYRGAAPVRMEVVRDASLGDRSVIWASDDDAIASVEDGWVTPVGSGTVRIRASLLPPRPTIPSPAPGPAASAADSAVVIVTPDAPRVTVGKDTTVRMPVSLAFRVKVEQAFGGIALFAWDLDGDSAWDDSLQGIAENRTVLLTDVRRFTQPGGYTLRFLVRDGEGNEVVATRNLTVEPPLASGPPVAYAGEDTTVPLGSLVTLRGADSDPDGDIVSRAWRSLSSPLAVSRSAEYTFQASYFGLHSFIYVVHDAAGNTHQDTVSVNVTLVLAIDSAPPPPVVHSIEAIHESPSDGDRIAFTAVVSAGGRNLTYTWDYNGDGRIDEKTLIPLSGARTDTLKGYFRYSELGEFPARLRVEDAFGRTDSGTIWVRITNIGNNGLGSLLIDAGALSPEFSPETYDYTATVHFSVSGISFKAMPRSRNSSLRINGIRVDNGTFSTGFPLDLGNNKFTIEVHNPTGEIVTYRLTVARNPSSVADLSQLFVIRGTLFPPFSPAITEYTVTVDAGISTTVLYPYVPDGLQSDIFVDGEKVEAGWPSGQLAVTAGIETVHQVAVRAEDGHTVKWYNLRMVQAL